MYSLEQKSECFHSIAAILIELRMKIILWFVTLLHCTIILFGCAHHYCQHSSGGLTVVWFTLLPILLCLLFLVVFPFFSASCSSSFFPSSAFTSSSLILFLSAALLWSLLAYFPSWRPQVVFKDWTQSLFFLNACCVFIYNLEYILAMLLLLLIFKTLLIKNKNCSAIESCKISTSGYFLPPWSETGSSE